MATLLRATIPLLLPVGAVALSAGRHAPSMMSSWGEESQLGVMNKFGVTRYNSKTVRKVNSTNGFYWPDATSRSSQRFSGATDLTDNVTWGWHHPNGVFATIPVGAPLIDGEMNIYLASDDAIRKFSPSGDVLWSYAPRGQIACAPTLSTASSSRRSVGGPEAFSAEEEASLRPDSATDTSMQEAGASQLFMDVKVGDQVRVLPGKGLHVNGKEHYKAGDIGIVREMYEDDAGESKLLIQWPRTGKENSMHLAAMRERFARIQSRRSTAVPDVLVGSTTSGWVFAISLANGEEVWATQASKEISGVKGSIGIKDGIVVVATNRCVDKYCYRYRNQTLLTRSNSVVRGLDIMDGRSVWSYKPFNPVWNFVPQFGPNDTVMFQDFSGFGYSVNYRTGASNWRGEGALGTHTEASAVYDPPTDALITMGVVMYEHKYCNPYPSPGILPWCGTWPGTKGWVKAFDRQTGSMKWEISTDEPPASATVGKLKAMNGQLHHRLVLTMGFNCHFNSPSHIWALDTHNGHKRWIREGPTLWTAECAGDFEAGDTRRALGGRSICEPGSWSAPAIDSHGDIYVGNQVGELQKYSSPTGTNRGWDVVSSLKTGVAFQDQSIAFAPGIMAVSTCCSLIVMQTDDYQDGFVDNLTMQWPTGSGGAELVPAY